ncbi:MAG TPA: lanthionine synthetase LanC family protein [Thermoanaerobaculia bacterium]|nr:lanthionine synthetase LanC family protein [Thermoanaerobaculia bacterium]
MSAIAEQTFVDTAFDIGAQLCRDAIWSNGECNWLGDSMDPILGEWRVVHRSFGPDFYMGTSGIAMFLARLSRYVDEPLLRSTARGAVKQALAHRDDLPAEGRHSLYSGWMGIALALLDVAEAFDDRALAGEAWRMIEAQRGCKMPEMSLDIIGGAAGTITGFLALYRRTNHAWLVDESARLARVLLDTANKEGDTWSWTTMPSMTGGPQRDLTGYSHGTAGIALAFLELHAITHDPALREGADRAIAYERKWFDAQQQNWPDFRSVTPERVTCGMAWCHGAPGVGLSRLRAYQLTGDESYRGEAEAAIRTTFAPLNTPTMQESFALCHGLAGNAELFLVASDVLRDPRYRSVAEMIARRGIDAFSQPHNPWPCGVNGGGETPGMMMGLAGIGWFYLRLHDTARVPSVLLIT